MKHIIELRQGKIEPKALNELLHKLGYILIAEDSTYEERQFIAFEEGSGKIEDVHFESMTGAKSIRTYIDKI